MMPVPIQSAYDIYQGIGYPGMLMRPHAPHEIIHGKLHIPSATTNGINYKPRPGAAVRYDAAQNAFRLPFAVAAGADAATKAANLAADRAEVVGIITYDSGTLTESQENPPDNTNSNFYVEYSDDDYIRIGLFGTFLVPVGEDVEFGDVLYYNSASATKEWEKFSPTTAASANLYLRNAPVVVGIHPVSDGNLAEARFSGMWR